MNERAILDAIDAGEAADWEFKSARGGIPGSLWESYSAMANTDGGVIVLGIEDDGTVGGLRDVPRIRGDLWNTLNNRSKVNVNLLAENAVKPCDIAGVTVLVLRVPRATRHQRPVFIGQNPLTGTYRRNYEGDYHCTEHEVARMLADRSEEPADSRVLEPFGLDDLDPASIEQYRNRFMSREPTHPWLTLPTREFLEKIGAWRADRRSGVSALTVAGILMFGKEETIRDPEAVPEFNLDYREHLSEDPSRRWSDRIASDGKWVCNVFQFYQRVVLRLTADIKVPFQLQPDLTRKDDTVVHEALREALVNALIHADYRGQGGVIVQKYRERLEFSNPGTLLLDPAQILKGGVSESRNKLLQTMFSLLGYGERAGSGYDKIRRGWASQNWRLPGIEETMRPDRVRVVLPMVSLLPEETLQKLKKAFGRRLAGLDALETQALVTAALEGLVSNARMREISAEHPADLTKKLQALVTADFLEQVGQKRGSFYRLPPSIRQAIRSDSSHLTGDSSHLTGDSSHLADDSSQSLNSFPPELLSELKKIAEPARRHRKLARKELRGVILQLCEGRHLTTAQLCKILDRTPNNLRSRIIQPMVAEGLLERKYPAEPNRPDQAYTVAKKDSQE